MTPQLPTGVARTIARAVAPPIALGPSKPRRLPRQTTNDRLTPRPQLTDWRLLVQPRAGGVDFALLARAPARRPGQFRVDRTRLAPRAAAFVGEA
jgi:hypothetical protein